MVLSIMATCACNAHSIMSPELPYSLPVQQQALWVVLHSYVSLSTSYDNLNLQPLQLISKNRAQTGP